MCPRKSNKDGKGPEDMTYKLQLRICALFSSQKRRLKGDLIAACNFLMIGSRGTC